MGGRYAPYLAFRHRLPSSCMRPTLLPLAFAVVLASFGSTVTAQTTTSPDASMDELEDLFWQRKAAQRAAFTEADVTFMAGMIGHHAQALIMSRLAPERGANPDIQNLAARIINAQQDEIATMQAWLRDREQPVPEVHIDGLRLMIHGSGHGHHDHATMPGMLSPAQLDELAAAQDAAFDRLFLTYMIQHHGGAITMVDDLFAKDGAGQDEAAFKLASDIHTDQVTEIERMQMMLDALAD